MTDERDKNRKQLREFAAYLLKTGNRIRLDATGQSMYPGIHHGDVVIIDPVLSPDELDPGNIIAWNRDHDMVVHRIIHKYETGESAMFLTRGDSCRSSDEPVPFKHIAGKVTSIRRKGKDIKPDNEAFLPEWRYRYNGFLAMLRNYMRKLSVLRVC